MYIYMGVRKFGQLYTKVRKMGHSYTFFHKGVYHLTGDAEKGGYSARISILCHLYGVTPTPIPWL